MLVRSSKSEHKSIPRAYMGCKARASLLHYTHMLQLYEGLLTSVPQYA